MVTNKQGGEMKKVDTKIYHHKFRNGLEAIVDRTADGYFVTIHDKTGMVTDTTKRTQREVREYFHDVARWQ